MSAVVTQPPSFVEDRIFNDFAPRLRKALIGGDDSKLYDVVPDIMAFFNNSRYFLDDALTFICTSGNGARARSFRADISEATQRMELMAQQHFISRLSSCASDEEKIEMIQKMAQPGTDLGHPVLNFERIPELQQEKQASGIGSNSCVLILGTGSISISGLYFASHGARVILLDRDPRAFDTFRRVYEHLPQGMQKNISFEAACDARSYEYPQDVTHICVAALLEPKEPVVNRIRDVYKNRASKVTVLLRTPRDDLMQMFYYNVAQTCLADFTITAKVDLGYAEHPANTFILKLK